MDAYGTIKMAGSEQKDKRTKVRAHEGKTTDRTTTRINEGANKQTSAWNEQTTGVTNVRAISPISGTSDMQERERKG